MRLGPFRLLEPLGRGGMGEVYEGLHERQGVPVAVKVIAEDRANDEKFRRAFADEIRAVARLDHPGIVAVYDHGIIPDDVADGSEGRLVARTPYFVMELVRGKSLRGVDQVESYGELRVTLLQLLDALAHAHARGVIHRDIKPGNVLFDQDEHGSYRIKLTDFGIARAASDQPIALPAGSSGTGTPGYMAPEQIVADMMAQGPWTDLYAVGCLAFRLATGRVPYAAAGDDNAVLAAHLREPVPELRSTFPVPEGFQHWVDRLLDKRPLRRFVRAADAIWALLELDDPNDDSIPARDTLVDPIDAGAIHDDPTLTTLALFDVDEADRERWGTAEPTREAPTCPIPGAGDAPPIPVAYERRAESKRGPSLLGVGLGLYGVRPVPLVGRHEERRSIWAQLRDVAMRGRPALSLLRGGTGRGKSRIAEWIAERAHELGSATVLHAQHAAISSAGHGLGAMLARHFQCLGVGRDAVLRHLHDQLGNKPPFDQLAAALTEIMHPNAEPGSEERALRFSNMDERYAAIGQLLDQLSFTRPVILVLDDVQWGADALGLTEYLLDRHDLRALVLATYQSDVADERPLEAARVASLLDHPRATSIDVPPLGAEEHRELVRHLLGLEGELAKQVEERTAGSPMFAVQLVGDWVRRGVLEVGKEGFRLRAGERAELPDSLHSLWETRVEQIVGADPDRDQVRRALELAAALGDLVDQREWEALGDQMGVPVDEDLVGRLLESGLARREAMGWSFCHGMFRESLERSASAGQRSAEHHRACAAMLRARYGTTDELAERLGRHLHLGGNVSEALAFYEQAIAYRFDRGDFDRVRQVVELRSRVLDIGGAAPDDRRRVQGMLWIVRLRLARGDYNTARRELRRAETLSRDHADLATICKLHAELRWARGQMQEAEQLAEGARRQFEALGDESGAADCRRIVANSLLEGSGDARRALVQAQAARAIFESSGDRDRLADCDYLEAKIRTELGEYEAAAAACVAAQHHHRAMGHRLGLAKCANQLGEIARLLGHLGDAEGHYLTSLELLEAMGSDQAVGLRLNLALVLIERKRYRRALDELRRLQDQLAEGVAGRAMAYVDYGLLPCLASEQEWLALDRQLDRARQWVPETGRVDKDHAALAERAATLAETMGERTRAMKLLQLALDHWQALGRTDRVDLAQRRLDALELAAPR